MGAIKNAELESIISNSSEVSKTTGILSQLDKDLAWELAQVGVDTTGIFDPSPTSDAIGMGMSLASGDWIGAGLSLISMIPYAGDALGKSAKMARAAKKIAALKKKIEGAIAAVNKAKKATRAAEKWIMTARKKAVAEIRAKIAKDAAKGKKCRSCTKDYGTNLPADGKWIEGKKGYGKWEPDWNSKRGKIIEKANKRAGLPEHTPIEFVEGCPNFSEYAYQHKGKPVIVQIDNMTGEGSDFTAANNAMKQIDPDWEQPEHWTWHHKEDGVTMELVPEKLNSKAGVPHSGGRTIVQDPGY